jgi:parvulin-like peptidyl-prolyl isomerase
MTQSNVLFNFKRINMQMMKSLKKKSLALSLIASLALGASANAKEVYATVDGEQITKEEIAMVLKNPQVNFDQLPKKTQDMVINQLIEKKLLTKAALASDVQQSKAFKEALEKIKKDLALEVWMQEEFKKVSVSENEISTYYKNNEAEFKTPEKLTARHILVENENDAKAIIKQLDGAKNKLEKFIELAKSKSTGPTGKNGGSLGEFAANQMVPEFSKAASALAKNSYSKTPAKTQFGYHVIYLEDKKPAKKLSFDEVKDKISQGLMQQKFRDAIGKKAEKLKETAKIVIN